MARHPLESLDANKNHSSTKQNFERNSKNTHVRVPVAEKSSEDLSCCSSNESCDPYIRRNTLRVSQGGAAPNRDMKSHTFNRALLGQTLGSGPYFLQTDDPYLDEAGSFDSDADTEISKENYTICSTDRCYFDTTFSLDSLCTNEAICVGRKSTPENKMVPTEVRIIPQHEPSTSKGKGDPQQNILSREHERNFWSISLRFHIHAYGMIDTRTIEIMTNLANAYLRCKAFQKSITIYQTIVGICQEIHHSSHISLAKPLDKVGMAVCWSSDRQQHLESALVALQHAFMIRYQILGAHHVDTVESLNNVAGFYLCIGELNTAKKKYFEVWVLRQAIFGRYHPSVAVTAEALGDIYSRMSQLQRALYYFNNAKKVYEYLSMENQNPNLIRLNECIASLEQKGAIKGTDLRSCSEGRSW